MYWFRFRFHLTLFRRVQLPNFQSIGSDNGLVPTRRQGIIWTNDDNFTYAYMHHSDSMSLDYHEIPDQYLHLYIYVLIYLCVYFSVIIAIL